MQGVLLEEQRVAHAGGSAGKGTVAAHRHRIAVRRNAPIGKPVGGVAQLAGVDHIFPAAAAPHPVVAFGHEVQVRHPAFQLHSLFRRDAAGLAAVQAGPLGRIGPLHQCAVKIVARRVGTHAQAVLRDGIHHAVPVQCFPLSGLLCRRALHGHRVPLAEFFLCTGRRDAAIVQRQRRPVAGRRAVHFQCSIVPPGVLFVLHLQEDLPVRRAFRLFPAHACGRVGPALRIAGSKLHALALRFPAGSQRRNAAVCRIKGDLVRKDQNFRTKTHQRLFAVDHRIGAGHGLPAVVRSVHQVFPADGQQPVQVVHSIQAGEGPQLPAGLAGAQRREIPG